MQALLRAGHDVKFRDLYAPLPYCRVSFARNRSFRDFLKFGTFDGCASGVRDGEYSESSESSLGTLSVNGYQKENRGRPSGPACCFVFGYRVGTGVPPWGPPPHPGPAVHSDGWTALLEARYQGNCRIVRLLVAFKADVNAQDRLGCAVSAAANRWSAAAESPPTAVQANGAALCRGLWRSRIRR
jgi:hypothetical protein